MLEITFGGRPGRQQHIAAIRELLELRDNVFTLDELGMITGASEDNIAEILEQLKSERVVQELKGSTQTYFGAYQDDGAYILTSSGDLSFAEVNEMLDTAEFEALQQQLSDLRVSIQGTELESEQLEALTEKWTEATVEVFREIQKMWPEPLALDELALTAGFDPDQFNIDYDEVNGSCVFMSAAPTSQVSEHFDDDEEEEDGLEEMEYD